MNVQRRGRLTAATTRLAVQPYPAVAQRCLEWREGVDGMPQLRVSHPVPAPIDPNPHAGTTQTLPASTGWAEQGGLWQQQQAGISSALELEYPTAPTVRMRDRDEVTVVSTMHTASMVDWNDGASDGTIRPSRDVKRGHGIYVSPEGEEDEGDCEEEGSEYAPSSRASTPPRTVSPLSNKARKIPKRKTGLDEDYDKEEQDGPNVDLAAVIDEEQSEPRAKRARFSRSADIEDHSARSSPSPPPPQRGQGTFRGKVAFRARWRSKVNMGSRDAGRSDST